MNVSAEPSAIANGHAVGAGIMTPGRWEPLPVCVCSAMQIIA